MLSAFPGDLSCGTLTGSAGPAGAGRFWVGVRSLGLTPQAGQRPPLQGGSVWNMEIPPRDRSAGEITPGELSSAAREFWSAAREFWSGPREFSSAPREFS